MLSRLVRRPFFGLVSGSLIALGSTTAAVIYANPSLLETVPFITIPNVPSPPLPSASPAVSAGGQVDPPIAPPVEIAATEEISNSKEVCPVQSEDVNTKISRLGSLVGEFSHVCVDVANEAITGVDHYSLRVDSVLTNYVDLDQLMTNISKLEDDCAPLLERATGEVERALRDVAKSREEARGFSVSDYRQQRKIKSVRNGLSVCQKRVAHTEELVKRAQQKYEESRLILCGVEKAVRGYRAEVEALGDVPGALLVNLHNRVERLRAMEGRWRMELAEAEVQVALMERRMREETERTLEKLRESLKKKVAGSESRMRENAEAIRRGKVEEGLRDYRLERAAGDEAALQAVRREVAREVERKDRLSALAERIAFTRVAQGMGEVAVPGEDQMGVVVRLWERCCALGDLMDGESSSGVGQAIGEVFDSALQVEFGKAVIEGAGLSREDFTGVWSRGELQEEFYRKSRRARGILGFIQSLITFDFCGDLAETESGAEALVRRGQLEDALRVMNKVGPSQWNQDCLRFLELRQLVRVLRKMSVVYVGT